MKSFRRFAYICSLLLLLLLSVGFGKLPEELLQTAANPFKCLMIGLFAIIFIILVLNEISIIENGYEKRYRFTLVILMISLLSLGGAAAILTAAVGMTVYLLINSIKESKFDIFDIIFKFTVVLIPTILMSRIFDELGGKPSEVNFPVNFILLMLASLVNYLAHTVITISNIYFHDEKFKKTFLTVFSQEYGWIIKYDIWQAIYAVLIYNSAIVFIYDNWNKVQTGADKLTSADFIYFLLWIIVMFTILYIPLKNWLSSFRTFIFYNQQNLTNVIQDMTEGIFILDNRGIIKDFNPQVGIMFGKLFTINKNQSFNNFVDKLKAYIDEGEIESALVNLNDDEKPDKSFKTEIKLKKPYSNYYNITITSEINRFNEITGNVVTVEDVTTYRALINEINYKNEKLEEYRIELEKRLKELQETQNQLIISEKMAVIGQLVAGVAHEINTPLASIKSNTELEAMLLGSIDIENPDSIDTFKENAVSMNKINTMALDRIIEIVKNLRNFARLDEADLKEVDLHEGIDSTVALISNQLRGKIKIVKEYGDIPKVMCFPQQLNQVFLNILVNAAQAIKDEGQITISTRLENGNVYIGFKDTGVGIRSENLQKVFDPGFTTKGVGVGTGLGLSISYKIIERHKGKIIVDSQVGTGTEFTIELPVISRK